MPEWTPPLLDRTYTHYLLLYNAPFFSEPKPNIQAMTTKASCAEEPMRMDLAHSRADLLWFIQDQCCAQGDSGTAA